MTATVETSTEDLGRRAVDLACQFARQHSVPRYYRYQSRLVTAQNVGDVAAQKLIGIAKLPSRLIGANRQQQQERMIQLETSLAINRRVGAILNARQLAGEIAQLIRDSYGYDQVWFYRWLAAEQRFAREDAGHEPAPAASILLEHAIELDRYPQAHLDLIRYWIGFYNAHRDTIIHGHFAPEIRLGHVPLIRFSGDSERIIGVYDDVAFAPGAGALPLWMLNASTRPFVELLPDERTGPHTVCTRDKFGHVVGRHTVILPARSLPVEVGGSLEICGL